MKKIIIGLSGEIGSGKGTVAKYIIEKYNGSSYSFSRILRDVLDRLYLEQSRKNLPIISVALRKAFGEDLFSKIIVQDVKKDSNEIIVIDGIRRISDIKYLRELPNFKLIYIESGIEECYSRIIKRNENIDDNNKTFEQFKKEHADEPETTIKELKKYTDYVIENNGTLKELYEKVNKIINEKNI